MTNLAPADISLAMPLRVLALRDKDERFLAHASSGGAFGVFARSILDRGGVVFGSSMGDDGSVCHIMAEDFSQLRKLQGSKYVQSDVGGMYGSCFEQLASGRCVLFTGTPCQISGLRSYLDERHVDEEGLKNLLTCDLICHGVQSADLFYLHQVWLSKKCRADSGILEYRFRSKREGWGLTSSYSYYRNGTLHEEVHPGSEDPYYSAFLRGALYRESCYYCPYAQERRVSDFTIGDYWGIEQMHPSFYDSRGVSVVLLNSNKAVDFFEANCSQSCEWIESTLEKAKVYNANLVAPTGRSDKDKELSEKVDEALKRGDGQYIFDTLLKPRTNLKSIVKKILPPQIIVRLKVLKSKTSHHGLRL